MKTPEEYYNSESKQQSGKVAGFCFAAAVVLLVITFIAELIKLY